MNEDALDMNAPEASIWWSDDGSFELGLGIDVDGVLPNGAEDDTPETTGSCRVVAGNRESYGTIKGRWFVTWSYHDEIS